MPDNPRDAYGEMAKQLSDETAVAGRYPFQDTEESNIFWDVHQKLQFSATDHCLDIGCGPGNLLIPLSFFVEKCMGIDHPSVIERLERRTPDEEIATKSGDFLELEVDSKFDKIIVYSVLHCLKNVEQVFNFVNKAMELLRPSGALLLGDIPNVDKKERFQATPFGKMFEAKWSERTQQVNETETISEYHPENYNTVGFDDELVTELLEQTRTGEYESYLYPQPDGLPFCHTREDILISRRPAPDGE